MTHDTTAEIKNMDTSTTEPKPDGAAFDTFFESIGKKTENLTAKEQGNENGAAGEPADNDGKVVDEIESLCMNCHENVSS